MKTYKSTIEKLRLVKEDTTILKVKLTNSKDVRNYCLQFWSDDIDIYESMYMITLNRRNNTTGYVMISQGGTAGTVVDTKLIAKYALENLSQSIIICHNHPSGETSPSEGDKAITNKVKNAMKLLDINLLDHIIITSNDQYFSFCDEGLIN